MPKKKPNQRITQMNNARTAVPALAELSPSHSEENNVVELSKYSSCPYYTAL